MKGFSDLWYSRGNTNTFRRYHDVLVNIFLHNLNPHPREGQCASGNYVALPTYRAFVSMRQLGRRQPGCKIAR